MLESSPDATFPNITYDSTLTDLLANGDTASRRLLSLELVIIWLGRCLHQIGIDGI